MIDYKEIKKADDWELFCRDYLAAQRFVIEIPPGRGVDAGRDLLVKEQLKGILATRPFTWLVSCKHNAVSGKSVGVKDEINIIERLTQHNADGFIGFYSTIASSSLIDRLKDFREKGKIEAFEIYDAARIEAGFHDIGLSTVLLQHLPKSYVSMRPIHPILGEYLPLKCEVCDKDLLKKSTRNGDSGLILLAEKDNMVHSVHFVCRGECDSQVSEPLKHQGFLDNYSDINNYFNPLIFLRRLIVYMNDLHNKPDGYSDEAHNRMIDLYLKISQRVLRQADAEDREKFSLLRQAGFL